MLNLFLVEEHFVFLSIDHAYLISEYLNQFATPGTIPCFLPHRIHYVDRASAEYLYLLLNNLGYSELLPCFSCDSTAVNKMIARLSSIDTMATKCRTGCLCNSCKCCSSSYFHNHCYQSVSSQVK